MEIRHDGSTLLTTQWIRSSFHLLYSLQEDLVGLLLECWLNLVPRRTLMSKFLSYTGNRLGVAIAKRVVEDLEARYPQEGWKHSLCATNGFGHLVLAYNASRYRAFNKTTFWSFEAQSNCHFWLQKQHIESACPTLSRSIPTNVSASIRSAPRSYSANDTGRRIIARHFSVTRPLGNRSSLSHAVWLRSWSYHQLDTWCNAIITADSWVQHRSILKHVFQ